MSNIYGAIITNKEGKQRLEKVEAKNLEEAITKLLAVKKPGENMNTPIQVDEKKSSEFK